MTVFNLNGEIEIYRFALGLLGVNASATARVISRRGNDDDEISYPEQTTHLGQVTGETVHTCIQPLHSPGIEPGPQRCEK